MFEQFLGDFEVMSSNELYGTLGKYFCHKKAITSSICENALFMVFGYSSHKLNKVKHLTLSKYIQYFNLYYICRRVCQLFLDTLQLVPPQKILYISYKCTNQDFSDHLIMVKIKI